MSKSPRAAQGEIPTLRETFGFFLRTLSIVRSYWIPVARGFALGIAVGMLGLVMPYLSKLLIDEVYPAGDVPLMHVVVAATLALGVASTLMGTIRGFYTQVVSSRLNSAISLFFFNHLQHLPPRFYEQHRVGEVMSRFGDVRGSLATVSRTMETVLLRGVYLILVPPVLFFLSWQLTVLSLLTIPLTTGISIATGRILRRFWKLSQEAYADLGAFQVEVFSNIRTLKTAAAEHLVYRKAHDQIQRALGLQLKAGLWGSGVGAFNGVIRAAGMAVFTWYGWTLILRGELTLGGFVAFTAYRGYLMGPLNRFASLFTGFQQAAVTFARMFEYLDHAPEVDPAEAYGPAPPIRTHITGGFELRNVSFSYTDERFVIRNVSLEVPQGAITAVVGPSGAGKSTLVKLLAGMEPPTEGHILIGGMPLTRVPVKDLRRQIAVVWQEAGMLAGTILENLTLGGAPPAEDELEEVIRVCRLDALIQDLPDGYDTPIAEWGSSLSAGQRQRVALARALIRNTPVVLLDEAMSNIDSATETEILRDMFRVIRGRTVLMVTHRLNTAAACDRMCVLSGGRLVGLGTHPELLGSCEQYRQLEASSGVHAAVRPLHVMGR